MMTPLSRDDLEALSAYLDGALSPRERAALESRLVAEPDLQAALDDLRRTVRILHAAPRLAVPRNYTLDPARFARRAPWWTRLDVFRAVGVLGAAASTALIVIGVLLGNAGPLSSSAPPASVGSVGNEVAMQASHTLEGDAETRGAAPETAAVGQSAVAGTATPPPSTPTRTALPTQPAPLLSVLTATPAADLALVVPSPFPSPAVQSTLAPSLSGEDGQTAASRQADSAADGMLAPGAQPPSPAEPLTQPTLALANFAAESFEGAAGAPATSEPVAALMGESSPALAAQATAGRTVTATTPATMPPLPTGTALPTATSERPEPTALAAATTAKAALPPVQMTDALEERATTTGTVSPTPAPTSAALASLPTEAPAPVRPQETRTIEAESPLPRLLIVAGLGLLVVSAVTWLIGHARRSRS